MAKHEERSGREIDRYNYVNRDIYSSSSGGRRPPKKKKGRHPVLKVFLCLVLLVVCGAAVYTAVMLSRVNRDDSDPQSYAQLPSDAPKLDVISDQKVMNILLIGADRINQGLQRSDTTMLVSIDNKSKKLRLVSFLRDLYVDIPTLGKNKLNASFSKGGAILTMQTIENNFRINVDRYIQIDVDSFAALIDKMGGIEVEVTQKEADEMNRVMDCELSAGKNHMRGTLALYYSRMRIIDSDFGRTGRQRQVIGCIIDKLKTKNPAEATALMYDYLPYVKTNLTDAELLTLASRAFSIADYPMETMHVPNNGTYKDVKNEAGAVLVPDLEKNCSLLREFLYPDDIS